MSGLRGSGRGLLPRLGTFARADRRGGGAEERDPTTMIVPRGTTIEVDERGQLSIRTPGNLVLQNSGVFGSLESVNGSIRIERGVEVEAATVRCSGSCYVQGSLTAWKVEAHSLHLEEGAHAHVVLQETESLEVGRDARLVGNFSSEDELFVLFSRFARQVRQMPFYRNRPEEPEGPLDEPELVERLVAGGDRRPRRTAGGGGAPPGEREPLPEVLGFARSLLVREADRDELGGRGRRVVAELVKLLDEQDFETLRHTHRTLFAKIEEPTEGVEKAQWLVEDHFSEEAPPPDDVGEGADEA